MRGTGFPKHAEGTELRGLCKALEFCALKTSSPCQLSMIVSRLTMFVDIKSFFFYALVNTESDGRVYYLLTSSMRTPKIIRE